jgi:hypothetical protein
MYKRATIARHSILFTDSKGAAIKEVLQKFARGRFTIVSRGGATAIDERLIKELLSEVRSHDDPIVLGWLGTCELTEKKLAGAGKYIKGRSYPYQNTEFTLTRYRDLRDRILYANSLCSIIFIDIPYYRYSTTIANKCISKGTFGGKSDSSISIKRDNKTKNAKFEGKGRGKYPSLVVTKLRSGKRTVVLKTNIDKELNNQVDYYNQQIKLISVKYKSPRLSQDLIRLVIQKGDITRTMVY